MQQIVLYGKQDRLIASQSLHQGETPEQALERYKPVFFRLFPGREAAGVKVQTYDPNLSSKFVYDERPDLLALLGGQPSLGV